MTLDLLKLYRSIAIEKRVKFIIKLIKINWISTFLLYRRYSIWAYHINIILETKRWCQGNDLIHSLIWTFTCTLYVEHQLYFDYFAFAMWYTSLYLAPIYFYWTYISSSFILYMCCIHFIQFYYLIDHKYNNIIITETPT